LKKGISLSSLEITDKTWLHFAGVAGSGMSALAQFHAFGGGFATGSDRCFDEGERQDIRHKLEGLGVVIVPQDGSFATAGGSQRLCDAVVVSTAVEDKVPDVRAARQAGVEILHRSELLAKYVADHKTIAITGTSGKSTVTAMVYSILRGCNLNPALLTGGPVSELIAEGHIGNAFSPCPSSGTDTTILVIEADESDGSVVRYNPWAGVVLNLGLDHKKPAEIMDMFRTFKTNTSGPFLVGESKNLAELRDSSIVFGEGSGSDVRAENLKLMDAGSTFTIQGVEFQVPVPGHHNIDNATAALAACLQAGVNLEDMVQPLANFQGVQRRFQLVGQSAGVEVIDDFAHNPDKIAAALATARQRTDSRVLAVFQPHGFGPTKFLKDALIETFSQHLRSRDILWMPEIFFAGGTVTRDISSGDLTAAISAAGRDARFAPRRQDMPRLLAEEAGSGDIILVMGARDPSLTGFCGEILQELESLRR
jgi:UDP-N-acetylmuramate--alanine ligase